MTSNHNGESPVSGNGESNWKDKQTREAANELDSDAIEISNSGGVHNHNHPTAHQIMPQSHPNSYSHPQSWAHWSPYQGDPNIYLQQQQMMMMGMRMRMAYPQQSQQQQTAFLPQQHMQILQQQQQQHLPQHMAYDNSSLAFPPQAMPTSSVSIHPANNQTRQQQQQHWMESIQVARSTSSIPNSHLTEPSSNGKDYPLQSSTPPLASVDRASSKFSNMGKKSQSVKPSSSSLPAPAQVQVPALQPPLEPKRLEEIQHWANSLVDQEWEIFWNDAEDSNKKYTKGTDGLDTQEEFQTNTKINHHEQQQQFPPQNCDNEEDGSQGSIIDDWYDGKILSVQVKPEDGTVLARAIFVGDETIYEMDVSPSKIRPSARRWIKRTIALLTQRQLDTVDNLSPYTAMTKDREYAQSPQHQEEHDNQKHNQTKDREATESKKAFSSLPMKSHVPTPSIEDWKEILKLRRSLQEQVVSRSKLSPIVNLHGSVKYVDGELNPTEPLVNHLVECCQDLEKTSDWYIQCWNLLTICFGQSSGQSSNELDEELHKKQSLQYDRILNDYLECGKNAILNCVSMDVESPTNSKRRALIPPSNQRRTKRRKKNKGGDHRDYDLASFEEEDFRVLSTVDSFALRIEEQSQWFLPIFAKMIRAVSHYVVDPLVQWKSYASRLLEEKDDLHELLEKGGEDLIALQSKPPANKNNEVDNDQMSTESACDDEESMLPYTVIGDCLQLLQDHEVLSLLDVNKQTHALNRKLIGVETTTKKALGWLERLAEYTPASSESVSLTESKDEILEGLQKVKNSIESENHPCHNIDPLGYAEIALPREVIDNAILWRTFLLDVQHASVSRERKCFIEDLEKRMVDLPSTNGFNLKNRKEEAQLEVRKLTAVVASQSHVESRITESFKRGEKDIGLFSEDEIKERMQELCALPYLSLLEERLSLRLAIMEWSSTAKQNLPRDDASRVSFPRLERLYQSLQLIFNGQTTRRIDIISKLRKNDKVDSALKEDASKDAMIIDSALVKHVDRLYNLACRWKERSESIISSLRMYENVSAGDPAPISKAPAMIDISRVYDLLTEYEGISVDVPGYAHILQKVVDDASQWSSNIESIISNTRLSMKNVFDSLKQENKRRPKGLIMNPTRQVLDMILELLEWYHKTQTVLPTFSEQPKDGSVPTKIEVSHVIHNSMYRLLAEGFSVVEQYAIRNKTQQRLNAEVDLKVLEQKWDIRHSKALSVEKIEANPLGRTLLRKMISCEVDRLEGFVLAKCLWVDWHISVDICVKNFDNIEKGEGEMYSLTWASSHTAKEPKTMSHIFSSEKNRFNELMEDARIIESTTQNLLSRTREMRKDCVENLESIREYVGALKKNHHIVRERNSGRIGLAVNTSFDSKLEERIKLFTWLLRTLSFPFLFLEETRFASPNPEKSRIPWDVLVGLAERIPSSEDDIIDDFALASMRIKELYAKAMKWQDEITKFTFLSNRGGKRRIQGPSNGEGDAEESGRLQIEMMQQLADHPILNKVAMPRESAVKTILRKCEDLEMKLHGFLSKDFDGLYGDRAVYPNARSLVGRKGEFILFRLTGSELFQVVKETVKEISGVAEGVLAKTPEKVTAEWIFHGVTWITKLNEAVEEKNPFSKMGSSHFLTIPEEIARELNQMSSQIFQETPRLLKSTLSQHGIFVSTNKADKCLKVALKKDGAHHSIGGTVIRWFPILSQSLSSDIARLNEWLGEVDLMVHDFESFRTSEGNKLMKEEDVLYAWYCFRERSSYLWQAGKEALVVSPKQGFVNKFRQLTSQIESYCANHLNQELNSGFAQRWFLEGRSVVDQRFILLEALLHRRLLDQDSESSGLLPSDGRRGKFRDHCRSMLLERLKNACSTIQLTDSYGTIDHDELDCFCCIRVWEIENEMFDRFQQERGDLQSSEEYVAKARNLKASLNDNNVALCLEILLGDISAEKLVDMSSQELASQKVKLARSRAEESARAAAMLVKGASTSNAKQEARYKSPLKADGTPVSILRQSRLSPHAASGNQGKNEERKESSSELVKTHLKNDVNDISMSAKLLAKSVPPPPPPPSLVSHANTFHMSDASGKVEGEVGQPILSDNGGTEFVFDIPQFRFKAELYLEDERFSSVNGFLRDSLYDKGRLPPNEFSRFIVQKAGFGGRSVAIPLRIVTSTDLDARQLSNLTNDNRERQRITMMNCNSSMGQDVKVFVVGPSFHCTAEDTEGVLSFGIRSSSYAIALTKDSRFQTSAM